MDDRAGEMCALRLLVEDDLLQGQLGEGGEGRARSDLGIRGDEACGDGRPRTIPRKERRIVILPKGVVFE